MQSEVLSQQQQQKKLSIKNFIYVDTVEGKKRLQLKVVHSNMNAKN